MSLPKYKCQKCSHVGRGIIKLGGLICEKCRVIMFYPSDKEYQEERKLRQV